MKVKEKIVIQRKPRMSGLTAAAARLGVSRTQLREVINGNRKSKRLMARLRDAGMSPIKVQASNESYVEHRYCESCRWKMKRAARACDPRYAGVGGHGDILAEGPIAR